MEDLFEGMDLTNEQVKMISYGLIELAAADGIDKRELAVIEQFYASTGGDPADLKGLKPGAFDIAEAKKVLDTREAVDHFLMISLLLIYADRHFSVEERILFDAWVSELEVDAFRVEALMFKVQARMVFAIGEVLQKS